MVLEYEESRRYLTHEQFVILMLTLAATVVFALVCFATGIVKELWMVACLVLVCGVGALFGAFLSFSVRIEDGNITVRMIRKVVFEEKRILDVKKGDIDILRDYSGWGRGNKIRYRTYALPGIDGAVSVKLGGKEVLTFTTENPDRVYDIIYSHRRQD